MNGLKFSGIGYPLKEPVLKEVGDTLVCNVDMAFNRVTRNRNTKEYETDTVIMKTTLWGNGGKALGEAVVGQPVAVEGHVKMESWQDQEGKVIKRAALIIESFKPLARIKKNDKPNVEEQKVAVSPEPVGVVDDDDTPF